MTLFGDVHYTVANLKLWLLGRYKVVTAEHGKVGLSEKDGWTILKGQMRLMVINVNLTCCFKPQNSSLYALSCKARMDTRSWKTRSIISQNLACGRATWRTC